MWPTYIHDAFESEAKISDLVKGDLSNCIRMDNETPWSNPMKSENLGGYISKQDCSACLINIS